MKKNKILIIDDNQLAISVLSETLQKEGYKVIVADSGKEALTKLKSYTPDLILLDIMMPEMDGFLTCQLIKENNETKDIPIIFLTALNRIEDITKGFKYGGVDYITKPFKYEELQSRVKTHLELNHQRQELKKLNSIKDKFFSIIAHDLRNPFNALIGLTDILLNKIDDLEKDKIKELLDTLNNSSKEGYELLENLLLWSKTQRKKIEVKLVTIDLYNVANGNIHLLQTLAKNKNIKIKLDIPKDYKVLADKNMLDTILRNLITNAIKFTPNKGKITIKASKKDDIIVTSVTDTGVGIPKENIEKLFSLDTNYPTIGTSNEKGTGLGLILCKEFIEKHGGKIWVDSKFGKGSTFSFSIKAYKDS